MSQNVNASMVYDLVVPQITNSDFVVTRVAARPIGVEPHDLRNRSAARREGSLRESHFHSTRR